VAGMTDEEIMMALIGQVANAAATINGSERDVTTIITRPLWRRWNRATGCNENDEPTEWLGAHNTRRIYGSETIVIDRPGLASVSFVP
jgi:hypothetical protein